MQIRFHMNTTWSYHPAKYNYPSNPLFRLRATMSGMSQLRKLKVLRCSVMRQVQPNLYNTGIAPLKRGIKYINHIENPKRVLRSINPPFYGLQLIFLF